MAIRFFSEEIPFKLQYSRKRAKWIKSVIHKEKRVPGELNYIFCSDSYLLAINQEFLKHDSLTDIITFDNNFEKDSGSISGDIFISIERIRDNANSLNLPFETELNRVLVHGVLHLIGYRDKKSADKTLMRKKEEAYLSLLK